MKFTDRDREDLRFLLQREQAHYDWLLRIDERLDAIEAAPTAAQDRLKNKLFVIGAGVGMVSGLVSTAINILSHWHP